MALTLIEFHQKQLEKNIHEPKGSAMKAKIAGFSGDEMTIERLKEMGLHAGLEIQCLGQAPFRGPLLFQFGNTVLALRHEEAECTLIQIP